jgi:biopolymer transport protein ExbD
VRPRRFDESPALDMTPVMSLVVHLIPMLLLSVSFRTLAQHRAPSPLMASDQAPSENKAEEEEEARPTVRISSRGFVVSGAGLPATALPCTGACSYTTYDFDGLSRLMEIAKSNRPEESTVVIAPEPDIAYDVVVKVFDTAGHRGARTLFPQPLIVTGSPKAQQ